MEKTEKVIQLTIVPSRENWTMVLALTDKGNIYAMNENFIVENTYSTGNKEKEEWKLLPKVIKGQ